MKSPSAATTCLVTGGTAGIGLVTARELVRRGGAVTIIGRDRARGEAAVAAIRATGGHGSVEFVPVDLSDQCDIRAFAETFRARTPQLELLVNNAGGLFGRRRVSVDGLEMTFAVNHLAYFLLTVLLLPSLRGAARARVVVVASEAHRGVRLNFDDLQSEAGYRRWTAYRRSKLANIMFTYELARRLEGSGVTVNALHPGFVATDIGVRHSFVPRLLWRIGKLSAVDPEKGAATSIHLAMASEVAGVTGKYFVDCRPARSSAVSYDRAAAERLWDVSANLTRCDAP